MRAASSHETKYCSQATAARRKRRARCVSVPGQPNVQVGSGGSVGSQCSALVTLKRARGTADRFAYQAALFPWLLHIAGSANSISTGERAPESCAAVNAGLPSTASSRATAFNEGRVSAARIADSPPAEWPPTAWREASTRVGLAAATASSAASMASALRA